MNLIEALSVFGVTALSDETQVSLKRRYRKLAKEKHPDRTGGGSEDFIALQEAYILLKKEVKHTGEEEYSSHTSSAHHASNNHNRAHTHREDASSKHKKHKGYVVGGSTTRNQSHDADQSGVGTAEHNVVNDADTVSAQVEDSNDETNATSSHSTKENDLYTETRLLRAQELDNLTKDELVEKYTTDTQELQNKLGSLMANYQLHNSILELVATEVAELSDEYRQHLVELQNRHQKDIDRLDKNHLYKMWVRYVVSPLTGKDIWARYRESVATYEQEKQQVKSTFNERLLSIYGESLNEMTKYLTTSSE